MASKVANSKGFTGRRDLAGSIAITKLMAHRLLVASVTVIINHRGGLMAQVMQ